MKQLHSLHSLSLLLYLSHSLHIAILVSAKSIYSLDAYANCSTFTQLFEHKLLVYPYLNFVYTSNSNFAITSSVKYVSGSLLIVLPNCLEPSGNSTRVETDLNIPVSSAKSNKTVIPV